MKRLLALLLLCSAVIDIAQQAYSIDLAGAIAKRPGGVSWLAAIFQSSIMTTIGHWGLFLVGFGILSLMLSNKKSAKSDALAPSRTLKNR